MTAGNKYLSTWDKPFAFPGQFGLRNRLEVQLKLIGDLGDQSNNGQKRHNTVGMEGGIVKDSRQDLPRLCAETRI
jgi:hypothetical protein